MFLGVMMLPHRKKDETTTYDDFEPRYMEKAKQFLYGEIAVRFQISFYEVEDFVKENIKRHLEEFS